MCRHLVLRCRVFGAVALIALGAACHAQDNAKCPDGSPVDGVARAGNSKHCLVIRRYEIAEPQAANVILVYLHGDNGGKTELPPTSGTSFALAAAVRQTTISVQRPGYRSDLGTSDGQTSAQDDDYTPGNVEIVADALKSLRATYPGKRWLLIGHSGGSAMAALVASRFSESADGYLLAGCPCDVDRWRDWRNSSAGRSGRWSRSLSPLAEAGKVPVGSYVRLIVGDKDDNTLPRFSEAYVSALRERGVDATLSYGPGADHGSIRRAPEFYKLANEMVAKLAQ